MNGDIALVLRSSIAWHNLIILLLKTGQPWLAGFSCSVDPFTVLDTRPSWYLIVLFNIVIVSENEWF